MLPQKKWIGKFLTEEIDVFHTPRIGFIVMGELAIYNTVYTLLSADKVSTQNIENHFENSSNGRPTWLSLTTSSSLNNSVPASTLCSPKKQQETFHVKTPQHNHNVQCFKGAVSRGFWPFLVKTVLQYLFYLQNNSTTPRKKINQILERGTNYGLF